MLMLYFCFMPSIKTNKLEPRLGLFSTTLAGVGVIIGAGIFVLIGLVASEAGSGMWLSFFLAAIVAILTGLTYAELSSMMSLDEGEGEYAQRAMNDFAGFVVAGLRVVVTMFTASAVAVGFSSYFVSLFPGYNPIYVSVLLLAVLTFFVWHGSKDTFSLNNFFTSVIILALLFIAVIPLFKGFHPVAWVLPSGVTGIFKGASIAFFAYLGYSGIIKLAEETKNPTKTIPRAIILSILISTVLYIAVAFSALSILGWEALSKSAAPLSEVVSVVFGSHAFIFISFVALLATANTVLLSIVYTSRGLYGLGEEFKKLSFLKKVGVRKTPTVAILISSGVALLLLFTGGLDFLAELTNYFIFITFLIVNVSLIILRFKEPKTKRPFKIPFSIGKVPIIPVLAILILIALVIGLPGKIILVGSIVSVLVILSYLFVKE